MLVVFQNVGHSYFYSICFDKSQRLCLSNCIFGYADNSPKIKWFYSGEYTVSNYSFNFNYIFIRSSFKNLGKNINPNKRVYILSVYSNLVSLVSIEWIKHRFWAEIFHQMIEIKFSVLGHNCPGSLMILLANKPYFMLNIYYNWDETKDWWVRVSNLFRFLSVRQFNGAARIIEWGNSSYW